MQYLSSYSPICPIDRPEVIDQNYTCIAKTVILPDRNITFTGFRDPNDNNYFFVTQSEIYQNGKRVIKTHRMCETEIKIFYQTTCCI